MWFKDSIQLLRTDEITATKAINGYINPESLDSNRVVQVVSTMQAKFTKPKVHYEAVAVLCEVILVDPNRPIIRKYSDLTDNEKVLVACQIEAAIDNLDWNALDSFRKAYLKHAKEITFSHSVVDNSLFHSNISIVPNYLN